MIDKIRALSSLPTRDKVAFENFTLLKADSVRTTDPHINQMLCYFEDKASQKRLARRCDIVPGELKELLSEIALLKPVFENDQELLDVTVQLMGTKLARFYGEQTGNSIYAPPQPSSGGPYIHSLSALYQHARAHCHRSELLFVR